MAGKHPPSFIDEILGGVEPVDGMAKLSRKPTRASKRASEDTPLEPTKEA